jgi:hypothetical protein
MGVLRIACVVGALGLGFACSSSSKNTANNASGGGAEDAATNGGTGAAPQVVLARAGLVDRRALEMSAREERTPRVVRREWATATGTQQRL